ncbi:helix-turn-helix domain-containing protein [Mesobacillus stamsii]|uniref:DNA-binding protein n=1 Tax=Mesobacillus stamsii TaxID=225347 RepID=A0ABU0FXL1_9BACI|nr:helix-turn-helix domain-containing protein [Mesobacillus stamsii]MDQ0414570.1 hypothetical protein [Mesobacillus stamsii]
MDDDEFTNEPLDVKYLHAYYTQQNDLNNIIGVDEAAKILNYSTGYVKNLCARKMIKSKKIGKTWVLDKTKLEVKNMKNGFLVTNNAYDAIVLANGTFMEVTSGVLAEYLDSENVEIEEWVGKEDWESDDIESFAKKFGDIIAYYQNNELVVVNHELLQERKQFHFRKNEGEKKMEIYYEDILVGEIITNRSMTVDEALNLIGFDEEQFIKDNKFDNIDYNDFKLVY